MKKCTYAILLIGVIGAISLCACHTWLRYRVIHAAVSTTEARERMAVVPTEKQIPPFVDAATRVSLGYAKMDLGAIGKVGLLSQETWVVLTNESIQVLFYTPFSRKAYSQNHPELDELTIIARSKYRHVVEQAQRMKMSLVDTQWEIERTTIEPFWRWVTMRNDGFMFYSLKLLEKLSLGGRWGYNQVFRFVAPQTKGIVRVGYVPEDKRNALVLVASSDDECNLLFSIVLPPNSSLTMDTALMPILGSLRFTTASLTDTNEIANMITNAGIRQYKRERTEPSN